MSVTDKPRIHASSGWNLSQPILIAAILLLCISLYSCRAFVYEPFRNPSASMHPTLPEDSLVIVRKFGHGYYTAFGAPPLRTNPTAPISRGDIVVFQLVDDPETHFMMRVIGLPGDRIRYASRQLSINGDEVPLVITSSDGRYQYATETLDGREYQISFMMSRHPRDADLEVPADQYFVMGDSRDNARDSRYIGLVPRSNIIGSATGSLFSMPAL